MTSKKRNSEDNSFCMATPEALLVRIKAIETIQEEREKKYLSMFASREEATKLALEAADRAVSKSEASVERRFETASSALTDMREKEHSYITRDEYTVQHEVLVERVNFSLTALEKEMSGLRERGNSNRIQAIILTCLMTGVFSMLIYLVFIHVK